MNRTNRTPLESAPTTARFASALAALVLAALPSAQEPALPAASVAHQSAIRRVVDASTEAERNASLDALLALDVPPVEGAAWGRSEALVAQLLYFANASRSTRDAMAFPMIAQALHLGEGAIVRGTVPFLESGDAALVARASGVLAEYEGADPERRPTFSHYRPFLEERVRADRPPLPGLTRHLFDTDPGAALLLHAKVHEPDAVERKRFLWAEHVLADLAWRERNGFRTAEVEGEARAQLEMLSGHSAWWARAAAARYLVGRVDPHAKDDDDVTWTERLLAALAGDSNPLVRAAATR